jgi:nucleoside-diphosphate kinase
MRKGKNPQRLFFMIKPDGMSQEAKIIEMIKPLANIIASRRFDSVESEKIEMLYEMHKGKDFYPYLMDHLKDRPAKAFLLGEREDVDYQDSFYDDFMALVGDTDPAKARPGTIRNLSTDSIERSLAEKRAVRNLVHRSTTPEETEREAAVFFWDYIHDHTKVKGGQGGLGKFLAGKGEGIFYEERLESGLRKCNLLSSGEALIKYRDLDGQKRAPAEKSSAIVETLKNGVCSTREITLQLKNSL